MLEAIDTHVHYQDAQAKVTQLDRRQQMATYFKQDRKDLSLDEMADLYRERNMMAVLVNTTDITVTGRVPMPNDEVAKAVKKHPDVFLGMGVVDPWQGKVAIDEVRRCAEELGLHGIGELNPARQHFFANDHMFYPLWEEIAAHSFPVMFHTGMAGAGAGTPGGQGVKLKFTRPIPYLDDIAADFPTLTVIGAHPSWPYTEESLAIALHKSNYFVDLSGWAPKYLPLSWVHEVNGRLQNKALFGSDYPVIGLDRWLSEFAELSIKDEVRRKILLENAARVFGVDIATDDKD